MRCHACPSFCGAASCGAVRSFEHTAAVTSSSCSTRYDTDTRFMYVFGLLVFLLSSDDRPLSVPMCPPPRKYRTYCRSERFINKHTAQRRAISSAQAPLGIIINSLFAPNNHGPLLPAPFIYMLQLLNSCILPSTSVAGGVSSLAEQRPVLSLKPHRVPPGIGRSTRYQVPLVRACTRLCFFVVGFVLHLGPLRDFFFANYTRTTADQNVTSPAYSTAQTRQSAPHK